jgi:uncharacterized membrane protein YtjA (UPF0391 family)
MRSWIIALFVCMGLAALFGFSGIAHQHARLARAEFVLYAGLLGITAVLALLRDR